MSPHSFDHISWQATGADGVVAAGGAGAVAAGIAMLEKGGNAADAAVATILALNVTDHGACSIGGEVPLLIYDAASAQVVSLSGQGRAPLSGEANQWYMANGIPNNDIKMAPVPAVVDLCTTALQRYGTLGFGDVAAPALALLDEGELEWHPRLADTLRRLVDEERLSDGGREEKLQAVSDRFYGRHARRNDVAEALEAFYIAEGGFLRRRDLAAHTTLVEAPVRVDYRGYTVYKCGPWTQGPFLCQALRLLEGFDLKAMGHMSAAYVHTVIEAIKLSMADRDAYYGDPQFTEVPLKQLLSDDYTRLRRPLIDTHQAADAARPGDPYGMRALAGDGLFRPGGEGTTTCVVADRWGNVVSATPSANVYHAGGSGDTGVSYGNRLRSLNTAAGHPNCIAPGKRPRITLTPTLVLKDGKPVGAISVAGGDLQDQAALSLLLARIDFGIMPAAAVRSPRFATVHHQDSFDPNPDRDQTFGQAGSLHLSARSAADLSPELENKGHRVTSKEGPIATPVMLWASGDGTYEAAGDPDAGRHAAALA
jgi:gamma-glutamyltranspeptidase / glutathione hydrolase